MPAQRTRPPAGRQRRLTSGRAGLAVFLLGFGAMNVFHLAGSPHPRDLPGLYDYASATLGDAIALPIMTAALLHTILSLPRSAHERWVGAFCAALAATIGVGTQALWLRDPAPQPNWTLPRAHHFTAAGWYHAVFLVAMCALTAALWSLALRRLASAGAQDRRECARPIAAATAAAAAFLVLLAWDNRPVAGTAAGRATLHAVVVGILLLAGLALLSRQTLGRRRGPR